MQIIKKYWISISVSIALLYFCVVKLSGLPKIEVPNLDKYIHFLMTAGLSLIIYFEQSSYFRKSQKVRKILTGPFLIPVLYTGAIELVQEYISIHRSGDWMDFVFDLFGAFTGLFFIMVINNFLKRKKK
jgi:hypothetical protein